MAKTIAFIPVRGGSKSIPLKNIKNLAGKPLLHWSLGAAADCPGVDQVVVATDSDEIAKAAQALGNSKVTVYRRQAENAQDTSSTEAVMLEYLAATKSSAKDLFILVQATNPFVKSEDFSSALKQMKKEKSASLLSAVRTKRFFWNTNSKPLNYDFKKRPRRQDFDGLWMENGAFYISSVGAILKSKNRLSGKISIYEMPEISGFEIDEPNDWTICESLLLQNGWTQKTRDFSKIKILISDIDGVMTDAGMYYSIEGDALKKFNTLDGMGINLIREHGIQVGIITGENTQIVAKRAQKLKIDILHQGINDKMSVMKELLKSLKLGMENVAYIGDDINDFEVLSAVGFPACPSTAVEKIKNIPGIMQMSKKGGDGVVREFIELILRERSSSK